ncbi:Ribosome-releasing factor 2, mitochondrial [Agyrium rufum]|nr:Ribosome-releasing factor 2, mitochondrial [Agyrium rufum]
MNHIPWHQSSPIAPPVVYYLCAKEASCIGPEEFEARYTLQPSYLNPSCSDLEFAARSQAWLYFGLLSLLLEDDFEIDDFLVNSPEGQTVIDSSKLSDLLDEHFDKYVLESRSVEDLELKLTEHRAVLSITLSKARAALSDLIVPRVKQMEKEDGVLDPWASRIYSVYFSIDILMDSLYPLTCKDNPISSGTLPRQSVFVSETVGLARSLPLVGRCSSLISRLHLTSLDVYKLLCLPTYNPEHSHRHCSLQACSVFNINEETYETKHSEKCHDPSCRLIHIDHQKLVDIIDLGRMPLISSSVDSKNNISLKILSTPNSGSPPYTAISHVWAGGLGNFAENALPECQLRQIHADVDNSAADISLRDPKHSFRFLDAQVNKLYNTLFHSSRKVYWLDTLCVPIRSADHRRKAINSMARIYAGALNVLVLDPELQKITRTGLTDTQLDLVVACSPWMARSWTLQEGALAVDLRLKFKETSIRLPTSADYPLLHRSLIQKPWYDDIDHKIAEGPSGSLFGYAYYYVSAVFYRSNVKPDDSIWRPADRRRSPDSSYSRFIAAWNDLTGRSTTYTQDLAVILGVLMNLSAGEILDLPEDQRMKALLKTQSVLPIDILFASPALNCSDWTPNFPNCGHSTLQFTNNPKAGQLKVTDLGLIIEKCDYTILAVQPDFPTTGSVLLKDLDSNYDALVSFDPDESAQSESLRSQKLLLFGSSTHDTSGYQKGLSFIIESEAANGILVTPHRSFAYKRENLDDQDCQRNGQVPLDSHVIFSPFQSSDISTEHPLIIGIDSRNWPILKWSRLWTFLYLERGLGENLVMGAMPIATTVPMLLNLILFSDDVFECIEYITGSWIWSICAFILLFTTTSLLNFFMATMECQYLRRREWTWVQQEWAASFWKESESSRVSWRNLDIIHLFIIGMIYLLIQSIFSQGFIYSLAHTQDLPTSPGDNTCHTSFECSKSCGWRLIEFVCFGLDLAFSIRMMLVIICLMWNALRMMRTHTYIDGVTSNDVIPPDSVVTSNSMASQERSPFQLFVVKVAAQALWAILFLEAIGGAWLFIKADVPIPDWAIILNHILFGMSLVVARFGLLRRSTLDALWRRLLRKPERRIQVYTSVGGSIQKSENDSRGTRNIGIIAHIDAGKTTTTERMLYYSGYTRRIGDVDDGSTVTDFLPAERARGITIQSAAITFHWPPEVSGKISQNILPFRTNARHTINLIDTPGHADFTFEVLRSLRVLDGAVCILDGVAGVEAQTEKVWHQASSYKIPKIIYVNKLDRDGAAFGKTVKEIASKLHVWPAICQIPWFEGGQGRFCGVVDIISLQALYWPDGGDGKSFKIKDLTELVKVEPRLHREVQKARTALVELLSEHDDIMVEKYLEAEEDHMGISSEDITSSLRRCVIGHSTKIVPVFAGASFKNIGVQPLLDAVIQLLPEPSEAPDPEVSLASSRGALSKLVDGSLLSTATSASSIPVKKSAKTIKHNTALINNLEACALAFKVVQDARRGVLVYVRVYHGSLARGAMLFNTNLQTTERATRLLTMYASDAVEVPTIPAGQIGVIAGLRHARTGDTMISYTGINPKNGPPPPLNSLQLRPIDVPPPVFFTSIEPERLSEDRNVKDALSVLLREDPSLQLSQDEESGQTLLSGMGELHLEIASDRLIKDFKAKAQIGAIEIGYRECVLGASGPTEAVFQRETSGKSVKAGCTVDVSPLEPNVVMPQPPTDNEDPDENFTTTEQDGNKISISIINPQDSSDASHGPPALPSHLDLETAYSSLLNGCLSALSRGPNYNLPMRGVSVSLTLDPTTQIFGLETTMSSLSSAARFATRKALEKSAAIAAAGGPSKGTGFMEPIMKVSINVTESTLGSVVHDLSSSRSGQILSLDDDSSFSPPMDDAGGSSTPSSTTSTFSSLSPSPLPQTPTDLRRVYAPPDPFSSAAIDGMDDAQGTAQSGLNSDTRQRTITARVPLREMIGYLKHLRSLTGGRGTFVMEFGAFERVEGKAERAILRALRGGR